MLSDSDSNSKPPTVSVVIPTYNHAQYICETLESVFAQTYTDFEVIVVNDGSPDETADVLQPYIDAGQIRYVEQRNQGQSAARNHGLSLARGEFVAFLDDDDLWPTDKLEWQVLGLRSSDAVAIGGTCASMVDGQYREAQHWHGPRTLDFAYQLRNGCQFVTPGQVLIRTEELRRVGGFDANIWGADDWDLWIRLSERGPLIKEDRAAIFYRRHAHNASHDRSRMIANSCRVVRKNVTSKRGHEKRILVRDASLFIAAMAGRDTARQLKHSLVKIHLRTAASQFSALCMLYRPALSDPRLFYGLTRTIFR